MPKDRKDEPPPEDEDEGKVNVDKFGWGLGDFEMLKEDAFKVPEQRKRRQRKG